MIVNINVVLDMICESHNYIEAKMTQSTAPKICFWCEKLSNCPSPFCDTSTCNRIFS